MTPDLRPSRAFSMINLAAAVLMCAVAVPAAADVTSQPILSAPVV